ncbi:MAG: pyridoxal phosphate-dependent aminotransferase [Erysipelotrichaceae bacterium]|nr:pyridoxal phosphate-dependent aminotransferase [Erysipelotrichaceae bacterium]
MFENNKVNLEVLKKRAYNYRWAEVGEDIIPLTAADPDYPCAPEIKQAMIEYVQDGYFSYTPKLGYDSFKKGISQALLQRKGEDIPYTQILPIDSAARGMYIIAEAFLSEGDEMIVFDPCDYLFRESALAAGATVVTFPASLDEEGHIDLTHFEDYVTPRTKMIGLCNPHNPYGKVYTKEQLEFLMSLCEKHDIYIMNDEIWSDIIYSDAEFTSIYALGNDRCHRVLSVYGFSKSFGLAGLRIGCIYCSDQNNFAKLVKHSQVLSTAGGIASISQVAGEVAVTQCYYWVDAFRKHLEENRDYAVERINKMSGLKAYRPQGTYLLFVDMSAYDMKAADFSEYLKETVKLAIVPGGREFFGDLSEGYFRVCFATSRAILEEGLDRLEKGIALLRESKGIK